MIFEVIGSSEELARYDKLRTILKDHSSPHDTDRLRQHDTLLAGLQAQVLKAYHSLVDQMKDLELSHLKQSDILPGSLIPEWKDKHRKVKRCKALLRTWSITHFE